MARTPAVLSLDPDRCDRCSRCIRACEPGCLKVGGAYIYVDWRGCTGCFACVDACDRGAIVRAAGSHAVRETPKPVRRPKASKERSAVGSGARSAKTAARRDESAAGGTWTLLEALAVIAVAVAVLALQDAVLAPGYTAAPSQSAMLARAGALSLGYALQIGVVWWLARRCGGLSSATRLARTEAPFAARAASVGLVAALLFGTRAFMWIYGVLARAMGFEPPGGSAPLTGVFGAGAIGLALSVLLVVVVGPLAEEIVFRGVLLPAFRERWGVAWALPLQAALFALYHFTPWLLIPTFVLGLAVGWLALTRRTLWPAVILHALYNLVPVALAFWLAA